HKAVSNSIWLIGAYGSGVKEVCVSRRSYKPHSRAAQARTWGTVADLPWYSGCLGVCTARSDSPGCARTEPLQGGSTRRTDLLSPLPHCTRRTAHGLCMPGRI